jgi:two-component system C4-dicarboxylate transport sensor histidine kinase DctB
VSDTGVGIPEEIKKTLFTPFASFSEKGTGLGLAITKQIITELGGEISVESIPGATVFHVLLPIYKGDSE